TVFATVFVLLSIALAFVLTTNSWVHQFAAQEPALQYQAKRISPPRAQVSDSLRVLNWNIKLGGARLDFFFDCYGERTVMTQDEVLAHLRPIALLIDSLNPDVLLVQEVDIDSKRSAY